MKDQLGPRLPACRVELDRDRQLNVVGELDSRSMPVIFTHDGFCERLDRTGLDESLVRTLF